MTLILELLIGFGAILLTSGLENTSLTCTAQWVWSGAPSGQFPPGCTPGSTISGNINTGSSNQSSLPISGGGGGGGSVVITNGGGL